MSEVVLRISEEGVIDRRLGSQGIWETGSENEQPRLESLPGDSVGGVAAGTFMHVSPRGAVTTDVKDLMCPDDPWNCWGMKLATVGPTVAVARVDGGADQEQRLAVLFGDVRERSLVPDTRVGGSGVLNVDLAPMLGSLWATGGSHSPWLAFDGEGRLLVMVTVAEPYGPDEKPPYTHAPYARALITARFVPDPQRGWILDPTYGAAGLDHVDLPMEGADSFVIEAFGVDTRGRPVIAGGWYNFSVDDAGNFVVRLTESGDFDRSYGNDTACIRFAPDGTCSALGSSGITWMPPNSPNIRGRPALDNRDNVYLSGALSAFGSRAKKQAAYRLGRVKPQGLIQVHDGRAWQSTQAQPRPRLLLDVQRGLPSSVTAGRKVWVTARVTLPSLQAGKVAPVKGATVSVMAMRPRGPSDRTPVASARTDARGYVRLRVTVKAKGSFAITAEANGYVGAGSDPVKVAVAPRSQPRSGERWLAHEPVG